MAATLRVGLQNLAKQAEFSVPRRLASPAGESSPTRDALIPHLDKVLTAPTTTVIRGIPTEVALDESDGMPTACVASLDNVAGVPQAFLTGRITTLSPERMTAICQALMIATDC